MFAVIIDMMELNKNNLRTIEAQIVQKLKNNEARPKFTGCYKKKSVYCRGLELFTSGHKKLYNHRSFSFLGQLF